MGSVVGEKITRLIELATKQEKSGYGKYLIELVKSVSMLSPSFGHHYLIHYKVKTITVPAAESLLAYENTIPGSSIDRFDVCSYGLK